MSEEPIQILLVEDNEDDVVMIREAFRECRLMNILSVARDGEEALRRLQDRNGAPLPGLILLDINMPRMDGIETLRALKNDRMLKSIPVCMMTTSKSEEDVVRSYDLGACSYVSKPVSFEALTEVVRQFSLYWTIVSEVPRHEG